MKMEIPSQQRRVGRIHVLSGRGGRGEVSQPYEVQPLVTRDEELFLGGDLSAEQYLSRVNPARRPDRYRERGYQRVELLLSVGLLIGGLAFFGSATRLFTSGGNIALAGLLASISVMLAAQLALEVRRRRRHAGDVDLRDF